MKKRIALLLVLLTLCMGAALSARAYETPDFSDVSSGHWAYTAIMEMADQKVINGVGKGQFAPDLKVSAAMFLTLTGRVAFPEITVTGSDWSGPYVSAAQNAGWLDGTSIRTDDVNADISRYDMAAVLAAAGKQLGLPSSDVEVYKIKDYAAIPNGYTKAVEQVYGQGLITGDGEDNFNGTASMTRAEASMVLWRLKGLLEKSKSPSAPVNTPIGGQDIYEKCSPAVFSIDTWDANGEPYAIGSGFFIDSSGLAVTNHHVLQDALSASVTLEDGTTHPILGVVEFDEELDCAVILVEGSGFPTLKIGDSQAIKSGEKVYAIGNPKSLSNTISDGMISNPRRESFDGMIQISVPISPGSSGGALLNAAGEVIGITTTSLTSGQNLNFAIPMDQLSPVEELLKTVRDPGYFTMAEYAEYNEYLVYNALPDDLADYEIYDETEPNNTLDTATRIYNGEAISGTLDSNGYLDCFTVHCNTPGCVEVVLFSDSEQKYLEDILLAISKGDEDSVFADYFLDSEGDPYLYLRFVVTEPGVYKIDACSLSLYETEKIDTNYWLYYTFTPGDTSGENTTGSASGLKSRREMAYNALVSWILNNSNTSAGKLAGKHESYVETRSENGRYEERSLTYYPALDKLQIHNEFEYNGAEFSSYIDLARSGPEELISYFYYSSSLSDHWDFHATTPVPISDLNDNYNFSFSQVDGVAYNMDSHDDHCLYLVLDSLHFADYVLQTYLADTGYAIEDFGYTSLNK